jgi:hypothetical protein
MIENKSSKGNTSENSPYFQRTLECSSCGGTEKIVLEEPVVVTGDKTYPAGSVLCAKCHTPTMVTIYRWTKWKNPGT